MGETMGDAGVQEGTLSGGPQDGAKVRIGGGVLPAELWVGPKWLGDGFAAWSRGHCASKPARYAWDGAAFIFTGWWGRP